MPQAGQERHHWSRIPVGSAKLIHTPATHGVDHSSRQGTGQRRLSPRAKLPGGSLSIDDTALVRGQLQHDETWASNSAIVA